MVGKLTFLIFSLSCFWTVLRAEELGSKELVAENGAAGGRDFDFSIPLETVSRTKHPFSGLAEKNVMLIYLSAKCVECQSVFPEIQTLAEDMKMRGVHSAVIAVKNNSHEDIRTFVRNFDCSIPVYQDNQKAFSERYGTGTVPLVVLINKRRMYQRIENIGLEGKANIQNVFSTGFFHH